MSEVEKIKKQLFEELNDLRQQATEFKVAEEKRRREMVKRLDLLLNLIRHLALDLDALLAQVIHNLGQVLPDADIRVIYLYDPQQQLLVPRACYGYDNEKLLQIRLQPGESMSGKVFQHGRPILTCTAAEVEAQAGALRPENERLYAQAIRATVIRSNICAPLRTFGGEVIGTISLSSTYAAFDAEDLPLLEGVAGQLAQTIANAQLFTALRESELKYRLLVEDMPIGICENNPEGERIYYNPRALEMLGFQPEDLASLRAEDLYVNPEDRKELIENLLHKGFHDYEYPLRRKDGRVIWIRGISRAIRDEAGKIVRYLGIMEDVTESRRREIRRFALQRVREEVWRMETESDIEKVLVAVRESLESLQIPFHSCGINVVDGSIDPPTVRFHSMTERGEWIKTGGEKSPATVLSFWRRGTPVYRRDLDAEDLYQERSMLLQVFKHSVRSVLDIPFAYGTLAFNSFEPEAFSEQDIAVMQELAGVLAEGFRRLEDLRALDFKEEQLRQAQKMEAIGHLAGGIAHDFNNLITVINGYSEFLLDELDPDDPHHQSAEEISKAGERAAGLVRQLLAFSRRQILEPEEVDLNEVVADLDKMLRRLISEDIELVTSQAPVLGRVYADRGQLEQIILNLAVNARDAMPRGGRLTIETANVDLDETYVRQHVDLHPGSHVLLVVSDTGVGMDAETQSHIFEPFYTTKGLGKGTGLGLSTIYGIIRQAHGHILVDSEPGQGATFKVFLPQVEPASTSGESQDAPEMNAMKISRKFLIFLQ